MTHAKPKAEAANLLSLGDELLQRHGQPNAAIACYAQTLELDPDNKRAAAMLQIAETFKNHPDFGPGGITPRPTATATQAPASIQHPATSRQHAGNLYDACREVLQLYVQANGATHYHHVLVMTACEQALTAMSERRYRDARLIMKLINDHGWLLFLRHPHRECRRTWRSKLPPIKRGSLACSVNEAAGKIGSLVPLLKQRLDQHHYHAVWLLASDLVESLSFLLEADDRQHNPG